MHIILLLLTSALLAIATPSPAAIHALQLRQDTSFPQSIPSACTAQCSVVTAITGCGTDSSNTTCLCSNTVGSELLQCVNCGVNLGGVLPQQIQAAQSQLNSFVSGCSSAGAPISTLTIGSTPASGGSTPSTPSASPSASPTGAALKGKRIPGGMVGLLAGVVLSVWIVGL
ncbi:hypothetical protein DACRYDRAFT_118897 [Dacryopinax primogenitus]|uniref:Extracellular membrane protein CFEM domain-containing protein n=1 Tax=Dacryopinax primogenitus (strain DJM 731) TaxID=1858805 RepID=M5G321_DACPD|nr:uncharacterized protein DACRYDRAFT_118897 [Dacryopinax primogenitus]EJT98152.1 hypothetical protein DACRYDRAFT_118897 [Dacryopinax primogenitus]